MKGLDLLLTAVRTGDFARTEGIVKSKNGKDLINAIHPDSKECPLSVAVVAGQTFIVRLLLEYHATPRYINPRQETLLHLAAQQDQPQIMYLLLTATFFSSAEINAVDYEGNTPLQNVLNRKDGLTESKDEMAKLLRPDEITPQPQLSTSVLASLIIRNNNRMFPTPLDMDIRKIIFDYTRNDNNNQINSNLLGSR